MSGRDMRPLLVLAFILVLLLLLRKGGDLFARGEDVEVSLEPIPPTTLPAVLVPSGGRQRETTDVMCNCEAKILTPPRIIYGALPSDAPTIAPVYVFAAPKYNDAETRGFATAGT